MVGCSIKKRTGTILPLPLRSDVGGTEKHGEYK
jgi:hypothetical protein